MIFRIENHLEETVTTASTMEEAKDLVYDLKERHGFYMEYTINEVAE